MLKMTNRKLILALLLCLSSTFYTFPVIAIEAGYYHDLRGFNTLTLTHSQNNIAESGLNLWGFVDVHGPSQSNETKAYDLQRAFVEMRLSHNFPSSLTSIKNLDLEMEYNDSLPNGGPTLRAGLTYKLAIFTKSFIKFRAHPIATSENAKQLGLIAGSRYHHFEAIGFVDYNLIPNQTDIWVTELELRYYIREDFRLLYEIRYNGFEKSNSFLNGTSSALGVGVIWN